MRTRRELDEAQAVTIKAIRALNAAIGELKREQEAYVRQLTAMMRERDCLPR
jgi:hypothetical protein